MTIQDAIREHLPAYVKLIENEYLENTIASLILISISLLLGLLIFMMTKYDIEQNDFKNNICVAIVIISMVFIIILFVVSLCHMPWEYFIYRDQFEAMAIDRICQDFSYVIRDYNFSINPFQSLK